MSVMSSGTGQYDNKGGWASNADLCSEMKFQLIFGERLIDKRAYLSNESKGDLDRSPDYLYRICNLQ